MDGIQTALAQPGPYRSTFANHDEESFNIGLFLVRPDPYTLSEFSRARRIEVRGGALVPFAAPEDIVLQKLWWFEAGNRVSDRQWNDILRVLDNQRAVLDYAYLGHWARELGVNGLLEDALAQRGGEQDPFA